MLRDFDESENLHSIPLSSILLVHNSRRILQTEASWRNSLSANSVRLLKIGATPTISLQSTAGVIIRDPQLQFCG